MSLKSKVKELRLGNVLEILYLEGKYNHLAFNDVVNIAKELISEVENAEEMNTYFIKQGKTDLKEIERAKKAFENMSKHKGILK